MMNKMSGLGTIETTLASKQYGMGTQRPTRRIRVPPRTGKTQPEAKPRQTKHSERETPGVFAIHPTPIGYSEI